MDPLDQKIEDIAQQNHDKTSASEQFSLASIPFHTHNGQDSNQISFTNVLNRIHIIQEQIVGLTAATATNYTAFFTAPFPMVFVSATEVHTTKGTVGTPTLTIEKLTGTTAPGSGTALLLTTFNLAGTINTVQYGTRAVLPAKTFALAKGDRLGLVSGGTLTSIADVVVTIVMSY